MTNLDTMTNKLVEVRVNACISRRTTPKFHLVLKELFVVEHERLL